MSIAEYCADARAWLAGNLDRLDDPENAAPPSAHDVDASIAANRTLQRRLFEAGYAGIDWPAAYGGQGLPPEYQRAFDREAARFVMPDFATLTTTTFRVCVPLMLDHGDPVLLRELVPKVLAGDALVCQFFSEPSSGSDLASVRTRAVRDGDEWVITGQKVWSSLAHLADWGMCLARTDVDVPKHQGLTWFAVPCDASGLTIRPITLIDGSTHFCEAFFDAVRIPVTHRIGPEHDGWSIAQEMLVRERMAGRGELADAAAGPGSIDPLLLRAAGDPARLRLPSVRQDLARAHTIAFVERALSARLAALARAGALTPGLASYSKLFRGTFDPVRARLALQIGGAAAVAWPETEVDREDVSIAYLRGKINAIGGGTNEMQRNAISERVLGMPREPRVDTDLPFRALLDRNRGG